MGTLPAHSPFSELQSRRREVRRPFPSSQTIGTPPYSIMKTNCILCVLLATALACQARVLQEDAEDVAGSQSVSATAFAIANGWQFDQDYGFYFNYTTDNRDIQVGPARRRCRGGPLPLPGLQLQPAGCCGYLAHYLLFSGC